MSRTCFLTCKTCFVEKYILQYFTCKNYIILKVFYKLLSPQNLTHTHAYEL